MKNYLFSGDITDEAKVMLKQDLIGAKNLVGITAGNDVEENDMYFYDGNEKFPATVNIFKSISEINSFKLLDKRINNEESQKILKNADVIFLTGGDPFVQIKYINDNGLTDIIKNFKGIIIGISAGAMNQGEIVYYSKDEDHPKTVTYEGLGLVNITIDPHYDITNKEQVSEHKKWNAKVPIIGLPNDSFIVVENNITTIYGTSYSNK